MLGKIRIETNGSKTTDRWKVYLNDVDITRYIANIQFDAGVRNRVAKVILEIPSLIEIPHEVEAEIIIYQANKETKE